VNGWFDGIVSLWPADRMSYRMTQYLTIAIRRQKHLPLLREAIAHCGLKDNEEILVRWFDLRACTWDHDAAEFLQTNNFGSWTYSGA
jgi:hypothetical protein